ncbi:MAG: Gfo/Idh/MocA family oxidoreductase [Planctomycetota bacterium]|nr:MAG: Gfo/Idh/MocA family oxidoreductase [Planctomycetota bacterium]
MIRVGVVGLGFMGNMHAKNYQALENAKLAAVCDIDQNKLKGTAGAAGNIEGAEKPLDLTDVELYSDYDKMLAEAKLDAVSITLPTYMHRDFTVKALEAGVDVLCEKPMALNLQQCDEMLATAKKSGKILQIGHCIRFWPEYVKTKEIIDSGEYGRVIAATFQRLSLTPTWSWDNWLLAGKRSGGAIFDLHIHDSDYVLYVFGIPKVVYSRAAKGPSGDFDHVMTQYIYDNEKIITAEGGFVMTPSFGFEMSFNIILEKATIVYDCTREPAFKICPPEGDALTPKVESGDGWSLEIAHFIKAVNGQRVPQITTPAQSRDSVKLILAERESAQSGKEVCIR